MADFIMMVEYETDDIDSVNSLVASIPVPGDVPKPTSVVNVRDRDRPETFATILRFNSYEEAIRRSESDANRERIAKLSLIAKGEIRFRYLEVINEINP